MKTIIRLLLLTLGATTALVAQDYYVATDGADDHPGTLEAPFRDPVTAAALLGPGDTLYFRAGDYRCVTSRVRGLAPSRSGEEGRPITFTNYQDEHVRIDCTGSDWGFTPNGQSWIVIDGFEITNKTHYGMKIAANSNDSKQWGSHIVVRNCEIHHSRRECLFAQQTPNLLIENCHMHHSESSHGVYIQRGCHDVVIRNVTSEHNVGNSGTQINAAGGGTRDALVERCLLRGCAQGYSLMGVVDGTFRHNVIVNNGFDGPRNSGGRELIMCTYGKDEQPGTLCEGNVFAHNTFVNLVPDGHKLNQLVHSRSGTRNCVFRDNIFVTRGKPLFNLESFDGFAFSNNCLHRIGGGDQVVSGGSLLAFCEEQGIEHAGNIDADPHFVDVDGHDLRLRDGSPCLGAGTPGEDGEPSDIGAHQRDAVVTIGCDLPWRNDDAAAD